MHSCRRCKNQEQNVIYVNLQTCAQIHLTFGNLKRLFNKNKPKNKTRTYNFMLQMLTQVKKIQISDIKARKVSQELL